MTKMKGSSKNKIVHARQTMFMFTIHLVARLLLLTLNFLPSRLQRRTAFHWTFVTTSVGSLVLYSDRLGRGASTLHAVTSASIAALLVTLWYLAQFMLTVWLVITKRL